VAGRPLASASAHGARAPVVSVRGNLSLSLSARLRPRARRSATWLGSLFTSNPLLLV
jgi:hypothetical protein